MGKESKWFYNGETFKKMKKRGKLKKKDVRRADGQTVHRISEIAGVDQE